MPRLLFCIVAATTVGCLSLPAEASLVYDFAAGDGGFTSSGSGSTNWSWSSSGWQTADEPGTEAWLTSSLLEATGSSLAIDLDHAYQFQSTEDFQDGGVLEYSLNGGSFNVLTPTGGYPNDPAADGIAALGGVDGWSGDSGGTVQDTWSLMVNPGDELQFRFRAAWIETGTQSSPNWQLSSFSLDNAQLAAVPEPATAIMLFCCGGGIVALVRRHCYRRQAVPPA